MSVILSHGSLPRGRRGAPGALVLVRLFPPAFPQTLLLPNVLLVNSIRAGVRPSLWLMKARSETRLSKGLQNGKTRAFRGDGADLQ